MQKYEPDYLQWKPPHYALTLDECTELRYKAPLLQSIPMKNVSAFITKETIRGDN